MTRPWSFYSQYYYMELNTARMLHDLNLTCRMEEEDILKKLQAVERHGERWSWMRCSAEAVVEAVKNGLLILTGRPRNR